MSLYQDFADRTAQRIAEGVLRPGDKLLSVRQACKTHGISPITVTQAYHLLETTTTGVDENDQVTMANLIVSTTCNNEAMNRAVRKIAEDQLSGQPVITEGLLNQIEVGIRAYDPCLSCATHALGQMPLEVTLVDAGGALLDRRTRSS